MFKLAYKPSNHFVQIGGTVVIYGVHGIYVDSNCLICLIIDGEKSYVKSYSFSGDELWSQLMEKRNWINNEPDKFVGIGLDENEKLWVITDSSIKYFVETETGNLSLVGLVK